ncbi:MAG: signal peptidase II [Rubricoccaceae bacterium]|nr:signal peptidase II [Rubricoccaceae bacterium]
MTVIRKRFLLLISVLSIVGCDRISKEIATDMLAGAPPRSYLFDVLRLSYHENSGSFLSLGAQLPDTIRFMVFIVAAGILLALFALYALRSGWGGAKFVGFALFVAGGIANWVDRIADGTVIDFLNVGIGPVRTGIFNVADMALMVGAVILLFAEYSRARKQRLIMNGRRLGE